ncbi:coiled-coil protein isoform X2 [Tasmannia lanceolata]|uniref:coiled-coil protein isoform X2 n=1 Tax=Tasmannia lanceolata TaxID=3420 RepID=UPI004063598B
MLPLNSMENKTQTSENTRGEDDEKVLQFLDSMDTYLTHLDSLSSTLRQGWLELASARHSMGTSRISSALFDLKLHPAATTLQVKQSVDESLSVAEDPVMNQPHFALSKWASLNDAKSYSEEVELDEELHTKFSTSQLRHRVTAQISVEEEISLSKEVGEEKSSASEASLIVDDQVQKERSKSLAVFGTLVSPKLRSAQISFETALETLIEIANIRSSMLSAYARVKKEMEVSK